MDNAEAQSLVQRPENAALLKTMIAEHPDIPKYFLKHALMFYLLDCIKFEGNKKKLGRKPKPPPIHAEIKGAVTVE
jgi:hypothetical protein